MARRGLALDPCVQCGTEQSDMTCPFLEPLDEIIAVLEAEGFKPHFNEIDDRMARNRLCQCTNCGTRGRFDYTGMKLGSTYRAFWSCRRCGHWTEV